MNKIGLNMHLWESPLCEAHYPTLEKIKNVGYDGVEVFLAEPSAIKVKSLKPFMDTVGLSFNGCLGLGVDENPVSANAHVRKKGEEKIKAAIDVLYHMGGEMLIGPFHSAVASFSGNAPSEDEYKRSAEVLHSAAEYASQANITLFPEALNRFECYLCNTMRQLKHLLDLVGHPNCRGMFDSHHASIEEKSQAQAIEDISGYLGFVHISENDRGTPGSGQVNFDEVFSTLSRLKYEGWITVEAFGRENVDFAHAVNVWRSYNPREDMVRDGFAFVKSMLEKHG